MAHHRALLASSVMTDYLWMRMITPCIIDPEIPKARRGLTVKGQAICKESSIRFPSGCVVLRWIEQGTIYDCRRRGLPKKTIGVNFKYIMWLSEVITQEWFVNNAECPRTSYIAKYLMLSLYISSPKIGYYFIRN